MQPPGDGDLVGHSLGNDCDLGLAPLPPPASPPPGLGDIVDVAVHVGMAPGLAPDGVAGSRYADLLKIHACKHLDKIMKDALDANSRSIFSVPLVPSAVQRLRDLLAPSLLLEPSQTLDAYQVACAEQPVTSTWMYFSVAQRNPSDAKRATQGRLTTFDIGISVHQLLRREGRRRLLISSAPVAMGSNLVADISDVPLVLSTHLLPLDALLHIGAWKTLDDISIDVSGLSDQETPPPVEYAKLILPLFEALLGVRGTLTSLLESNDHSGYLSLLDHYRIVGVVEELANGFDVSHQLTAKGKRCVRVGTVISEPTYFMKVREALAFEDMTTFELMQCLERDGFNCVVYARQERRDIRKAVYSVGDEKVWYLSADGDVDRMYLIALLRAGAHRHPVPARATTRQYKDMLGMPRPATQRRRRRLHMIRGDDSWDEGEPRPPQLRLRDRAAGVRQRRRQRQARHHLDPVLSSDERDDSQDNQGPSTSSRSSSLSSPSRAPQSDSGHRPRSSSSSGSDSNSDNSDPSDAIGLGPSGAADLSDGGGPRAAPDDVPLADVEPRRPKNMYGSTPFGMCRLTPRFSRSDASMVVGQQMTCNLPNHTGCTKSISYSVGGGADVCLRKLKHWVLLGIMCEDATSHTYRWDQVLKDAVDGVLPSQEQLDANAPDSIEPGHAAPPSAGSEQAAGSSTCAEKPVVADGPPAKRAKRAHNQAGDAKAAAPGTPVEVQERMRTLLDEGKSRPTTKQQRRRDRCSEGMTYLTPPALTEALRHSYIHPNLAAPEGHKWKRVKAGVWSLLPSGG